MKKVILSGVAMIALATATLFTTSCKKDEVLPSVVAAYSSDVIMNNQKGTASQFGKLNASVVGFSTSADFDLAYGNGSASGNKYFIGGPNDPSVQAVYTTTGTTQTTFKVVAAGVTTAVFDTLTNSKAVISIVDAATATDLGSGTVAGTRVRSNDPWAVGTVFAFQTSSGKKAVAKVTAAPSGTSSTLGSIGLTIKFY